MLLKETSVCNIESEISNPCVEQTLLVWLASPGLMPKTIDSFGKIYQKDTIILICALNYLKQRSKVGENYTDLC